MDHLVHKIDWVTTGEITFEKFFSICFIANNLRFTMNQKFSQNELRMQPDVILELFLLGPTNSRVYLVLRNFFQSQFVIFCKYHKSINVFEALYILSNGNAVSQSQLLWGNQIPIKSDKSFEFARSLKTNLTYLIFRDPTIRMWITCNWGTWL